MFVDISKIKIRAGKGGDGSVHFHREKYVAAGGPDGGDGGKGGDVVFQVDQNLSTLIDFKYKTKYAAEDGQPGAGKNCFGRDGKDIIIKVPLGTVIKDANTGRIMADMSTLEPVVLAKGGRGGWGNSHFATPTRQIPRFAKPGLPGEEYEITLELKLLADVGLVGFPNVGKSTLISVVSSAKPKIANYHFTTLTPVLGVVKMGEGNSFVMADIPGLIEGASEGVGLGHEFLRHVDRCRLIVHVVDVSGIEGRDPEEDYAIINRELRGFSEDLAERPQIVAGSKIDLATPEQIESFRAFVEEQGLEFYPISAATHQGVDELMQAVSRKLADLPPIRSYEPEPVPLEEQVVKVGNEFSVHEEDGVYTVEADWLGQVLGSVNMDDYESLQYFQRVLINSGIIAELERMGIQEGDTVRILDFEFDFIH